jgi:hypothetical protein
VPSDSLWPLYSQHAETLPNLFNPNNK